MALNFDFLYGLKTGKTWWLDVLLYFVLSLLVALIISYILFGLKISFQKDHLQELEQDITKTGTRQQKEVEKKVFLYQKKLNDFVGIFEEHKVPSNLFALIEDSTLPNVWFTSFILSTSNNTLNLRGETDDFQTLARQISIFEENKLISEVNLLGSSLMGQAKIDFTLGFSFNGKLLKPFSN